MGQRKECNVWCPYKQGKLSIAEIKDYLKIRIKKATEDKEYPQNSHVVEYLEGKINADRHLLSWIIERERFENE